MRLKEGATFDGWAVAWNGGGTIERRADTRATLAMTPAVAATPSVTHSALVVSVAMFADTDVTITLRTMKPLRRVSPPNPWEVGWAIWHYTDRRHFYYVILKPNGWELGKADPAYPGAQRFLSTGADRIFPIGSWYTLRIMQTGSTIVVAADGRPLTTFVDHERPYLEGSIALYCEDSAAEFGSITGPGSSVNRSTR